MASAAPNPASSNPPPPIRKRLDTIQADLANGSTCSPTSCHSSAVMVSGASIISSAAMSGTHKSRRTVISQKSRHDHAMAMISSRDEYCSKPGSDRDIR